MLLVMLHLDGTQVECEEWGRIIRASIYGSEVGLRKDNVNDRSILSRSQLTKKPSVNLLKDWSKILTKL